MDYPCGCGLLLKCVDVVGLTSNDSKVVIKFIKKHIFTHSKLLDLLLVMKVLTLQVVK